MGNFFFHTPYLLLFIIIPLIFIGYIFFSKKNFQSFSAVEDMRKVFKYSNIFYTLFFVFAILLSLIFVVLFAGLHKKISQQTVKQDGVDIMLVMDLSYSMYAEDLKPTRMEVGKQVVEKFLEENTQNRIGMVLFSGRPFLGVPLTFDTNFLTEFIGKISPEFITQNNYELAGTAIGDALLLASENFDSEEEEREKIILLFTDGTANKGIDPLLSLEILKEKNIKVYSVGIGKEGVQVIRAPNGILQQIGGVDEKTLKKISTDTGGKYYRADSKEVFQKILSDISQLEKMEIQWEQLELNKTYNIFILFFGIIVFILFLGTFFLTNGIFIQNSFHGYVSFLLLIISLFFFSFAFVFEQNKEKKPADFRVSFVLDVSKSMLTEDMKKISRLNYSKAKIIELLSDFPFSSSLTIFSGTAQRTLPFTDDRNIFSTLLLGVDYKNIVKQGSDIFAGIEEGVKNFTDDDGGLLVIITDGSDEKIEVPDDFEIPENVSLYIVGVGTKKGGKIPTGVDPFGRKNYKVYNGDYVVSQFFEKNMISLAKELGGKYIFIDDIENITDGLSVGKSETKKSSKNIYLFLSFLFFLLYLGILGFYEKKY